MPWLTQLLLFGGSGAKEAAAATLAELAAVGPGVHLEIQEAGAVQLLRQLAAGDNAEVALAATEALRALEVHASSRAASSAGEGGGSCSSFSFYGLGGGGDAAPGVHADFGDGGLGTDLLAEAVALPRAVGEAVASGFDAMAEAMSSPAARGMSYGITSTIGAAAALHESIAAMAHQALDAAPLPPQWQPVEAAARAATSMPAGGA